MSKAKHKSKDERHARHGSKNTFLVHIEFNRSNILHGIEFLVFLQNHCTELQVINFTITQVFEHPSSHDKIIKFIIIRYEKALIIP